MIRNNYDNDQKNLTQLQTFLSTYGEALTSDEQAFACVTGIILYDSALAGKVLGKTGWTRAHQYGGGVHWHRYICNITVTIYNAESIDFNGPVPESAFPLQLEDASASILAPAPTVSE